MVSQKNARKKEEEVYFATEFATRMNLNWLVRASDSEGNAPDLIVATPEGEFGLEHTQVFMGKGDRAGGSPARAAEGARARRGKDILEACERKLAVTLHIQFSSHVYRHTPQREFELDRLSNDQIVDAVCSLPLSGARLGDRFTVSELDRCTIWVKRAFRSRWEFIQDGVGYVAQSAQPIEAAIADKAKKLAKYRANNLPDVRLLVVANRIRNSGKLIFPKGTKVDRLGFNRVYFFSYPDQTVEF
jgi:hypothetical protein